MEHSDISVEKDTRIEERMQEIQKKALSGLDMVEKSLTDQIKQIEEAERDETKKMQETLQEKTEELKELQAQHISLEAEISKLRRREEKEKRQSIDEKSEENRSAEVAVSKAVLERLQAEVLTVVERVKRKNDTIVKLKTMIEEHKGREAVLKKELRRMKKRSSRETEEKETSGDNGSRQTGPNPTVKTSFPEELPILLKS
jgi:chromosome segregation ATPase